MKYLVLVLFIVGCEASNTPSRLKARDEARKKCAEECAPRAVDKADVEVVGRSCTCVDEDKK